MNEFEAHESSYDHQHKKPEKQRLKEMKQMQRDPLAASKARKAERKADEKSGLISIKPVKIDVPSAGSGGGFKKGGFKSAFGDSKKDDEQPKPSAALPKPAGASGFGQIAEDIPPESDTEDEGYEMYDPRYPTD
ncbi:MAG: hypothetical protein M1825_002987 [Sarcosagium campestre]|nr:MAG: hypothetical protein M1825_002987 [Sarcosagium campestre]